MYDFHTHFIPQPVLRWLEDNKATVNAVREKKDPNKAEFLTVNGKWGFELKEAFVNASLYLEEQAKAGVTTSVVSPIPQLFLYEFDKAITSELSGVYNRALADWSKEQAGRIEALGTVPLNSPEDAARELENAMALGLKGVIIGPGVEGRMLTDESFHPFWEAAHAKKAIVFIHPLLCEDPRLKKRMMPNLIGVPWETTVCATDILLSGLMDQYENAKILLAHGGGLLPYQIGRLEKGYAMWSGQYKHLKDSPKAYLKRFWFDNVLWNEAAVDYLTAMVGEDRVVPGSDYPFDLCAWPPIRPDEKGAQALLG